MVFTEQGGQGKGQSRTGHTILPWVHLLDSPAQSVHPLGIANPQSRGQTRRSRAKLLAGADQASRNIFLTFLGVSEGSWFYRKIQHREEWTLDVFRSLPWSSTPWRVWCWEPHSSLACKGLEMPSARGISPVSSKSYQKYGMKTLWEVN